jgi:hypothetical protein
VSRDALKSLHNLTDADRAPPDPSLCVEGKRPVASKLAARLLVDLGSSGKYLLYGARGGGKSTQMHDLRRRLTADLAVVDIAAARPAPAHIARPPSTSSVRPLK